MIETDTGDLTFALHTPSDALGDPEVRGEWEALLKSVNPLNRLYASPIWFEHLRESRPEAELHLGVARDRAGQIVCACPILVRAVALQYEVAARTLARSTMWAADVLGSELMLAPGHGELHLLTDGIFRELPACQCIYMDAVPTDSPTWRSLQDEQGRPEGAIPYVPYGIRPWHSIELGGDFNGYLGAMKGKARYNLRRTVRELGERTGGPPVLLRVDSEGLVDEFLAAATSISAQSWQHRLIGQRVSTSPDYTRRLKDLASRKVLRSYLVTCGGEPRAFAIGYQHDGVYQFVETGYDESLGDLSPGTVLLYLLVEELFAHNPPSQFNFGVGDGTYKRRFGNRESSDATVFLLRRGPANRLRRASHGLFNSGVRLAKRLTRRQVSK